MASFRTLVVDALLNVRPGLERVHLRDGSRAYNLTEVTGPIAVGDEVVVNTTAVELGLGTGGWHVVHWNLRHREVHVPGGGHIMKLRYSGAQIDTGAYEEHHPSLRERIDGVPVVVCSLHSQMAVVAAAIAHASPTARIAYVMTDGAALPIALSDLVCDLLTKGVLCGSVTTGHAFGGTFEAVTVPSGLCVAVDGLRAEAIVVAMGPGAVGTGTALGTSAIEVGPILDAVGALGGIPILCPRASSADRRPRHQGLSHHTITTLERFTHTPVRIPIPPTLPPASRRAGMFVQEHPDPAPLLAGLGLRVTTMGRGPTEDPLFFACAAAAGTYAGRIVAP